MVTGLNEYIIEIQTLSFLTFRVIESALKEGALDNMLLLPSSPPNLLLFVSPLVLF